MGLLNELKLRNICRKEGREKEYEQYKKQIEVLKLNINSYKKIYNNAIEKFTHIQQNFPEDSKEYNNAKDEVYRWKMTLEEHELQLKFIRPNLKEDIEYRDNHGDDFIRKLQSIKSSNLDLRFHGTPIYFAEKIIKSGAISSSADRYDGYIKSTDMRGEISASNIQTLGRTIDFFSDMAAYRRCLPAGCIFALIPKDEKDATYGYDLMHSVDFRENPEQLFGVFTTPENIKQVKSWMNEASLNSDLVYTFEGFLEAVEEKSKIIDEQVNDKNPIKDLEKEKNEEANRRIEQKGYLFEEEDIKEIAMQINEKGIRSGKLQELQDKIKSAIKELRNKFKATNFGEIEVNSESERDRD